MRAHVASLSQCNEDGIDVFEDGGALTLAPLHLESVAGEHWKLRVCVMTAPRAALLPHLEYADVACNCVLVAPCGVLGHGRCGTSGSLPALQTHTGVPLTSAHATALTAALEAGRPVSFALDLLLYPTKAEKAPDIPDGSLPPARTEPREAHHMRRAPVLLGHSPHAEALEQAASAVVLSATTAPPCGGFRLSCRLAVARCQKRRVRELHLVLPALFPKPHAAHVPPCRSGRFLACFDGHRIWTHQHGRCELQRGPACPDLRVLSAFGPSSFLLSRAQGLCEIFDASHNQVLGAARVPAAQDAATLVAHSAEECRAAAALVSAGDVFFMPHMGESCGWQYAMTLNAHVQPLRGGGVLLASESEEEPNTLELVLLQGVTSPPGEDADADAFVADVERVCLLSEAYRWGAVPAEELLRSCQSLGAGVVSACPCAGLAVVAAAVVPGEEGLRLRQHAMLGRATQVQWLGEPACAPVVMNEGTSRVVFYIDRGGFMHRIGASPLTRHSAWRFCNPSRSDALLRTCTARTDAMPHARLLFSAHANDLGSCWRPQSIADAPVRVCGRTVVFPGLTPFCAGHAPDGRVLWARPLPSVACDALECRARLLVSTQEAVLVMLPESGVLLTQLPLAVRHLASVGPERESDGLACTHADGTVTLRTLTEELLGGGDAPRSLGVQEE